MFSAPDVEITLFTTAFQAVAYLVAMTIANVFYNLGRWTEALLRPGRESRLHYATAISMTSVCLAR